MLLRHSRFATVSPTTRASAAPGSTPMRGDASVPPMVTGARTVTPNRVMSGNRRAATVSSRRLTAMRPVDAAEIALQQQCFAMGQARLGGQPQRDAAQRHAARRRAAGQQRADEVRPDAQRRRAGEAPPNHREARLPRDRARQRARGGALPAQVERQFRTAVEAARRAEGAAQRGEVEPAPTAVEAQFHAGLVGPPRR